MSVNFRRAVLVVAPLIANGLSWSRSFSRYFGFCDGPVDCGAGNLADLGAAQPLMACDLRSHHWVGHPTVRSPKHNAVSLAG